MRVEFRLSGMKWEPGVKPRLASQMSTVCRYRIALELRSLRELDAASVAGQKIRSSQSSIRQPRVC
jgi:hypothetical protein